MYERKGYYYTDFVHDGKRYVKSLKTKSKSVAKELDSNSVFSDNRESKVNINS